MRGPKKDYSNEPMIPVPDDFPLGLASYRKTAAILFKGNSGDRVRHTRTGKTGRYKYRKSVWEGWVLIVHPDGSPDGSHEEWPEEDVRLLNKDEGARHE